jgi:hypothetical protein
MNGNADIGKQRRSLTYPADQQQLPLFQLNGRSHIFVSRYQKHRKYGPNQFILAG